MARETDKRGSRRTPCFTAVYISHPEDGAGRGTDRERGAAGTEIHCCRILSPELNPLMLRRKFMKEGGEQERTKGDERE